MTTISLVASDDRPILAPITSGSKPRSATTRGRTEYTELAIQDLLNAESPEKDNDSALADSATEALRMTALSAVNALDAAAVSPLLLPPNGPHGLPLQLHALPDRPLEKRSPSFPDSTRPLKKTRGVFSEERRLEVRNVRSKGACLRCRMLKKPVSTKGNSTS